ncbi:hypothetical protein EYF80_045195 [Liparis tanakae]|uniref:Secreted protein n=1 Tax=Liparis tanakae TaxID=230148 RepID=A0A4Z2FUU5_9TELE|nr:hypothetical protein EYF80_045195 [Liparis tanakae]
MVVVVMMMMMMMMMMVVVMMMVGSASKVYTSRFPLVPCEERNGGKEWRTVCGRGNGEGLCTNQRAIWASPAEDI